MTGAELMKLTNMQIMIPRVFAPLAVVCAISAACLISSGCSDSSAKPTEAESLETGKKIYAQYCAACHQADGSGVPNMQPDLRSNAVVKGDEKILIRVLLQGPDKVLPAERERYSNVMPPFAVLNDDQVSALLTYLRKQYGDGTSAIDAKQAAAVRAQYVKGP